MKKSQLILAAAALVAFASCSNEGYTPSSSLENEIGFNAVTRMATRANDAIITGATYDKENSFKVWGWQSEAGDFSESLTASNFMSGLTIEWTSGRDSASTEPRPKAWRNKDNYYYWPFTGKISFLAVHPSTVAPTTTGWDATNKKPQATIADYTIAPSTNETTDLMFATNEGARQAADLPMVFKHALSQIQFRVRTDYDYTLDDVVFKVNSVAINKIDLSGDVTYANNAITWADNADQTESWAYYSTTQVVNYAATDAAADLYGTAIVMIPQAKNVDNPATTDVLEGTTITINYTMKQKDYEAITGTVTVAAPWAKVKEGDTNYDPAEAIDGWEVGKKYNYTLCFKLNEITFDPTVTKWVEVDVQTINILD